MNILTKVKFRFKKLWHAVSSSFGINSENLHFKDLFLGTLLPNYVVLSYSISSLMNVNKGIVHSFHIHLEPIVRAFIIIVLTILIPVIIQIKRAKKDGDKIKILGDLLYGITSVVNDKSRRFHSVVHRAKHNEDKMSKDEIFTTITQPKQQYHSICTALLSLISRMLDDNDVKLNLVSYSNGKFISLEVSTSADDTSESIPAFLNNNTMAKFSAINKKMLIMECKGDVESFYEDTINGSHIRSMITYPVCNEEGARYVICLSSHVDYTFKRRDEKLYNLILSEFGKRIILESYLDDLKGQA